MYTGDSEHAEGSGSYTAPPSAVDVYPSPNYPPPDEPSEDELPEQPYCRSQQESLDAIADMLFVIVKELQDIRILQEKVAHKLWSVTI